MSVPETNAFPHKDYNSVSYSNDIMLLKVKETTVFWGVCCQIFIISSKSNLISYYCLLLPLDNVQLKQTALKGRVRNM